MHISDLGYLVLLLGVVAASYGGTAAVVGHQRGLPELIASARNAVMAVAALLTLASGLLIASFLRHDFSLAYVAQHSSLDMAWYLTLSAFYGGQEGSFLYWAWALSLFSAFVVWRERARERHLIPYVMAVLMAVQGFFLLVMLFASNPFKGLPFAMPDGRGLNPLLEDPGMLIHPPMLLAGYMSWSVPYAFAMAALLSGRLGVEWLRPVRRYALVAWAFQGAGLLLGAWWAYHVLGWGGYWGWDPVENVAFLPFVLGTAFLHSIMVEEHRGMLKAWNYALVILTFALSILGTLIVRSGVLASVHSFAEGPIGYVLLGFLSLILIGSFGLLFYRSRELRREGEFRALASREVGFLVNNWLLVGVAFTVFWGTMFPLISEAARGAKITVGPPFFNQVLGPIFLAMLLLMGIGPLLSWRRTPSTVLLRNLRWPVLGAGLAAGSLALVGPREPLPLVSLVILTFVAGTIAAEYGRGVMARRRNAGEGYWEALRTLVARNRARYGGYLVHLAVVLLALGVVGSAFFQKEGMATLAPGGSMTVGPYTLTYRGLSAYSIPGEEIVEAEVEVQRAGKPLGNIRPGRAFHRNFESQPTSRIVILTQLPWLEDLYVVLAGWEGEAEGQQKGAASFNVFVNPLVSLLWLGGVVFLGGTAIALWPQARERKAEARTPEREMVPHEV